MDRRSRFLLTKTEPQVCWAPALPEPKLAPSLLECKAKVEAKRAQWAQTLELEAVAIADYFARKHKTD